MFLFYLSKFEYPKKIRQETTFTQTKQQAHKGWYLTVSFCLRIDRVLCTVDQQELLMYDSS